jgi:hypothetical protein
MNQLEFEKTEVFEYLQSLKIYAYGDLQLFHELSKNAELLENNSNPQLQITQSSAPTSGIHGEHDDSPGIPDTIYSTGNNSSTTQNHSTQIFRGSLYAPPPISVEFRATIPFTLMMFACMEMLGYLAKQNGKARNTEENIKHFFSYVAINIAESDILLLVRTYRHGLAHNYFPKLNQAISYHSSNPLSALFFKLAGIDTKILDVNFLELCFRIGLEKISKDPSLFETMTIQYTRLIDWYKTDKQS